MDASAAKPVKASTVPPDAIARNTRLALMSGLASAAVQHYGLPLTPSLRKQLVQEVDAIADILLNPPPPIP